MTLVRRAHRNPVLNTWFDDYFTKEWRDMPEFRFTHSNASTPATNIIENENEFVIELAVPGMKKDEFKIELDKNILTISSENKEDKEEKKENYTRQEFNFRTFSKSFTLPLEKVESDQIKAKLKNGILNVEIPKKEEAKPKPARLIEIG